MQNIKIPEVESPSTEVLNMRSVADRRKAAGRVADQEVVAIYALQYGAVLHAEDQEISNRLLHQVKGGRKSPVAVWINDPEQISKSDLVDFTRIHEDFHDFFQSPDQFAKKTQGLCMIRFPVNSGSEFNGIEIHNLISSEDESGLWMQTFFMGENQPYTQAFINELYQEGVKVVGITSLNLHKEDTPQNKKQAVDFCREQGIKTFISDDLSRFTDRAGSHPIIRIADRGAELVRPGNIHPDYLEALGWHLQYPKKYTYELGPDARERDVFKIVWEEFPNLANLIIRNQLETNLN